MLWLIRTLGAFQSRISHKERVTGKRVTVSVQNVVSFRDADPVHTLRMAQVFHATLPSMEKKLGGKGSPNKTRNKTFPNKGLRSV